MYHQHATNLKSTENFLSFGVSKAAVIDFSRVEIRSKIPSIVGFPQCAQYIRTQAAPQTLKYGYITECIQIAVYIVRINENGLLSASAIIITTTNWRGGFKPSHLLLHCKTEFTPGLCFHFHPKLQVLSQVLTKVHVHLQTTAVLQDCKAPGGEQPDILIQLPSNFKTKR